MLHITLPDNRVRRLTFYVAMEEYVARHVDADECFFVWQVQPTVIFGRNQVIDSEVNLEFCKKHHIQTYRRKSGGGCVYADMRNLMLSYVKRSDGERLDFHHYLGMIVALLQRMGIDANVCGRNDVVLNGKKVSGNAFYRTAGHDIMHGTLLYDADLVNMVGAITPTQGKLLSKGISDVRQRIDLLKLHTHLTLEEVKELAIQHFSDAELMLSAADVAAIETLEKDYLDDDFIYGNVVGCHLVRRRTIGGVGEIEARIQLHDGVIQSVNLLGDFFLLGDLDEGLLRKLRGVPLTHEALTRALPDRIDDIIYNLMKEDFVLLLCGE